jgi:hypothetical protein
MFGKKKDDQGFLRWEECAPSLREAVKAGHLDFAKLSVPIEVDEQGRSKVTDRSLILLTDRTNYGSWEVRSLRELFRGTAAPPASMQTPPPEYDRYFAFIEMHVLQYSDNFGDKTDGEFEEIFSNLRRRPDGRSLGPLHDYLWQVLAVLLGGCVLSEAQYEAIVGRLALSASHFKLGPSSRFYTESLRCLFERVR